MESYKVRVVSEHDYFYACGNLKLKVGITEDVEGPGIIISYIRKYFWTITNTIVVLVQKIKINASFSPFEVFQISDGDYLPL